MTNWIIQSDLEIQELHHDWNFLRAEIEFDTVAGDWSYTPVTDITAITKFAQWKTDELRVYLKGVRYGWGTLQSGINQVLSSNMTPAAKDAAVRDMTSQYLAYANTVGSIYQVNLGSLLSQWMPRTA